MHPAASLLEAAQLPGRERVERHDQPALPDETLQPTDEQFTRPTARTHG